MAPVARALGHAALQLAAWIGWKRGAIASAVVFGPIITLNVLVAYCGRTAVFPLSPRYLRNKATALALYAAHRPKCMIDGHQPMGPAVARTEARYHIPAGLLAALVQVESAGIPHRISPVGAMGPGQLLPSTARAMDIGDPFDTDENVDGSGRYLAQQLARFHDVRLAVAAYNAGPGAVMWSHGVPHNGETEFYVERVMRVHRAAVAVEAAARARIAAEAAAARARTIAAAEPPSRARPKPVTPAIDAFPTAAPDASDDVAPAVDPKPPRAPSDRRPPRVHTHERSVSPESEPRPLDRRTTTRKHRRHRAPGARARGAEDRPPAAPEGAAPVPVPSDG